MAFLLLLVLSIVSFMDPAFGQSCFVTEKQSGENRQCQFPFTFGSIEYTECTGVSDPQKKLWCSTKTDTNGVHEGGKGLWGYCPENCHLDSILDQFERDLAKGEDCPCTHFESCSRITEILAIGDSLQGENRNETRKRIVSLLKKSICVGGGDGIVKCCPKKVEGDNVSSPGSKSSTSTPTTTTTATTTSKKDAVVNVPTSGTYLPSPANDDCGSRWTNFFVVGGEETEPGEFTFMALLGWERVINRKQETKVLYGCGGSLINKKYVVSAAHCMTRSEPDVVLLGEWDITKDIDCDSRSCIPRPQVIPVGSVINHPRYDPGNAASAYDIALVRLESPATLYFDEPNKSILVPVCLPFNNGVKPLVPGTDKLTVIGYGRINNDRSEARRNVLNFTASTAIMQKLDLPLRTGDTCADKFGKSNWDRPELRLCAGGEPGKDSCKGDSGGPLIYKAPSDGPMFLVGVVSFGTPDCGTGVPGAYTRVEKFLEWIKDTLRP